MESHEVMAALREHAETLGWEIAEWDWLDVEDDGTTKYMVWLSPAEPAGSSPADSPPLRHASPHCACGINGAGQRYVDPICVRPSHHLHQETTQT